MTPEGIPKDSAVRAALKQCRNHFLFAALFNAVGNLLVLAYPLYIMNVYGRVLTSQSKETLAVLFVGLGIAGIFKAVFSWLRGALFLRAGLRIDRQLSDRLLEAIVRRRASGRADLGNQVFRDLDAFRAFSTGAGANALIDMPWAGLFLAALVLIDPIMAIAGAGAIVLIVGMTVLQAIAGRSAIKTGDRAAVTSYSFVDGILASAEAVVSMGMLKGVLNRWHEVREPTLAAGLVRGYRDAGFQSAISYTRLMAQGGVLAVGVLQVLAGQTSAGVVFGAMFVFQFALTPFDKMMLAWTNYGPVKEGLRRLDQVLSAYPSSLERTKIPRLQGPLEALNLAFIPPGRERPIVKNLTFGIRPGISLGVVGLIGSGKTTLARLLVGCTKPSSGSARLAGQELFGWTAGEGGQYVGYLPQNIALVPATVAENIGRFGLHSIEDVIDAARRAGAHELIQRLPLGYDTVIGPNGHALSGGQQQLIGLARAVVGNPTLVVLDEANSNLDGPGESALMRCIHSLKEQGTTVVLISHRPGLVRQLDRVMILKDGTLIDSGDPAEVLDRQNRSLVVAASTTKSIPSTASHDRLEGPRDGTNAQK